MATKTNGETRNGYCDWCGIKTPSVQLEVTQRGRFCPDCDGRSPRQVHQTSTFDPDNPFAELFL